jgi:diadenosine tetraphosphatase ApaH/serine/threonine PP2A family protein phosphatase
MERLFQMVERFCFQGHTHVPGIFTESYQFFSPDEIGLEYTLGEGKVMVNVGSVGQPRDGDPRACYVILDDGLPNGTSFPEEGSALDWERPKDAGPIRRSYRRLRYDFETTIQKIYAIPELEPFLGDRLRQGR